MAAATHQAFGAFRLTVPQLIRQRYGNNIAAMTEAAVQNEYARTGTGTPISSTENTAPSANQADTSQVRRSAHHQHSASPVQRLQTALAKLGFYARPLNGVMDQPTRQAFRTFAARVPSDVRQHYGDEIAAMAEAAVEHRFVMTGE